MKNTLLLCFMLPTLAICQKIEGEVHYEEITKIEMNFGDSERIKIVRSTMPKSRTAKKQLLFNSSFSLYKNLGNLENEEEDGLIEAESINGGRMRVITKRNRSDRQVFQNLETAEVIEKREFMGKDFLIQDEQKNIPWKLTGEQKKILEYPCQKAIWKDSSRTVEAWFTLQVPVSIGPATYAKLPGLILQVNIDNGKRIITATKVELKKIEADLVTAPKKGKTVTREEFRKIVAEKTKELQETRGGKGSRIRFIERQ